MLIPGAKIDDVVINEQDEDKHRQALPYLLNIRFPLSRILGSHPSPPPHLSPKLPPLVRVVMRRVMSASMYSLLGAMGWMRGGRHMDTERCTT